MKWISVYKNFHLKFQELIRCARLSKLPQSNSHSSVHSKLILFEISLHVCIKKSYWKELKLFSLSHQRLEGIDRLIFAFYSTSNTF